jgi:peptidoglycan/xylan/chitin deacetylase (PgdA/CDA1 family)
MFFDRDIKGNRLPPKTLCLTYDDGPGETAGDGPGPRTPELARYLAEQGIRATFFVVGRRAERHPDILAQLRDGGHLVGNHTYSHPGLVSLALSGGDVVAEVARGDEVIRPYVSGGVVYFRAPYGNWREKRAPGSAEDRAVSIVAEALNRSGRFRRDVGPVNWDISGHDYDYWREGASAEACAREYLERIEHAGRGIVLMHDSSVDEALRANNRTLEVTRLIVPALREQGYRFVGLDAVPQVESAVRVAYQVALRAVDGAALVLRRNGSEQLTFDASPGLEREAFGVVPLGAGRVALRASDGMYLSVGAGGAVVAEGETIGDGETLEMAEQEGGGVALRAGSGEYLGRERGGDGLVVGSRGERAILSAERLFLPTWGGKEKRAAGNPLSADGP